MTRREEIVKATKECRKDYVGLGRHLSSDDIADAFEEGAYWADKTMIEKACQWMKSRFIKSMVVGHLKGLYQMKGLRVSAKQC